MMSEELLLQHPNNNNSKPILVLCNMTKKLRASTVATTDMAVKLGITLPKSILRKLDQTRADIPRSRYIRRAIENYLSKNTANSSNNENKSTVTKKRRSK
jgi:Ribbon-helix-helix domain